MKFDEWTEEKAKEMAKIDELELTEIHWLIIGIVRNYYSKNGKSPTIQVLLKQMRERLGVMHGYSSNLKRLFPGYVEQVKKLSFIPGK